MNQNQTIIGDIKNFNKFHDDLLKELYEEIYKIIKGKREIMYSDLINLIIRNHYQGEVYNQLIVWCNYNIKRGHYVINL